MLSRFEFLTICLRTSRFCSLCFTVIHSSGLSLCSYSSIIYKIIWIVHSNFCNYGLYFLLVSPSLFAIALGYSNHGYSEHLHWRVSHLTTILCRDHQLDGGLFCSLRYCGSNIFLWFVLCRDTSVPLSGQVHKLEVICPFRPGLIKKNMFCGPNYLPGVVMVHTQSCEELVF